MARQKKPACLKQGKSESKAQLQQRQQIEEMLSGDDGLVYSVPQNLDSKGQIFYEFIVEELRHSNILTNIDIPLLEQTVQCMYVLRKCSDDVRVRGILTPSNDKNGNLIMKENPSLKIQVSYMQRFITFCNQLGLSPASRASLASRKIEAKIEEQDPLLKVLRGGK